MSDPDKILNKMGDSAMGQFGKIKSFDDLPSDKVMINYLKEAANLNKEGVKLPLKAKVVDKKSLVVPDYLKKALNKNKKSTKDI